MGRFSPRWLLLFASLFLLWNLGYAPFWNPDEGRYASASLEMTRPLKGEVADWLVPHLNTIPRLNKPPLVYWLAAASFRVFGPSEIAGRLVPALAAILVLLLLWRLGSGMFSERAGIMAALVWATAALPFGMARVLNTDMLLTCGIVLALCGLWWALEEKSAVNEEKQFSEPHEGGNAAETPVANRRCWSAWLTTGFGFVLAMLAKGPVGVALPIAICGIYLWATRRWYRFFWPGFFLSLLLVALLAAPWFYLVEQRQTGFLNQFLLQENLGRFSGAKSYHSNAPVWFYLPVIVFGFMPWTAFLWPVLAQWKNDRDLRPHTRARLFLGLWAVILIVFFSLSHTKLISYVLPAFPPIALLIGATLAEWESIAPSKRRVTISINILLSFVALAAAIYFLSNNKTVPRSEGTHWIILIVIVIVASAAALFRESGRNVNGWRLALMQTVAAAMLWLTLLPLAGRIALYGDASSMMQALAPYLHSDDRFASYGIFQPTSIYYLQRPSILVDFSNNAGLDDAAIRNSPLFISRTQGSLQNLLAAKERIFILLKIKRENDMKWPAQAHIVASNNDYLLLSNRPTPAGFYFDYVAPARRKIMLSVIH